MTHVQVLETSPYSKENSWFNDGTGPPRPANFPSFAFAKPPGKQQVTVQCDRPLVRLVG